MQDALQPTTGKAASFRPSKVSGTQGENVCQERLRVVVVDEELPYPPNSGKRIRTLNLLLRLAKRHRITYLCHRNADPEEARQAEDFFRAQGIETVVVDRAVPDKSGFLFYLRLLGNLFSRLPYSVQIHKSTELQRAVEKLSASQEVDLWHCEWTPYGESLCGVVESPWVAMAHNIESVIWQRYYTAERSWLKRWYIKRQWRKFERFDRRILCSATQAITVSEADATLARERFCARQVEVVDNGVDIGYFRPKDVPRDHKRILFLGSLDWRPNLDGVQLLLDEVFPRVLASEPSARLAVVGRKPPAWLVERIRASRNVELHADVPDVRPFLQSCGVLAVPLRVGGGSRLKILEALATECPVVSTRVGAEGLCLSPGEHFVQVEDTQEMAEALVRHIRRPEEAGRMARLGRQVVVEQYEWQALADKLETIWRKAVCTANSDGHLVRGGQG
jgi:glycosyltransferase involved in cell wall biosynthesis